MTKKYMFMMNMSADASWCAPACQSAHAKSVHSLILDTAIGAVSFLSESVRISLQRLVRMILPEG